MTESTQKVNHLERESFFSQQVEGHSLKAITPFPPLPPIPDAGDESQIDPTSNPDWPPIDPTTGKYAAYTMNDDGYMQVLMNQLSYTDVHSGRSAGFIAFTKTIFFLDQLRNKDGSVVLTDDQIHFLTDTSNSGALSSDMIDYMVQYAFLYGYGGNAPGTVNSLIGFAQALQGVLPASSSNPILQHMIDECKKITTGATTPPTPGTFAFEFMDGQLTPSGLIPGHLYTGYPPNACDVFGNPLSVGDIIWPMTESVGGKTIYVYYDWTQAQSVLNGTPGTMTMAQATQTANRITSFIQTGNGVTAGPNPDIDSLDAGLHQMKITASLDVFNEMLKLTGGDVGIAILAFIYQWEGYQMDSSLSGPADIMDGEKQFSQMAKQIEDDLKQAGTLTGTQVGDLAGNTIALFEAISTSGQFADGLGSAVESARETFETTIIIPGKNPSDKGVSLWDLFTGLSQGTYKPSDVATALNTALAPTPTGDPLPSGSDSGALALQGILGGYDGLVTAVSSNSTAEVTTSQQGESLITAMDKVMTGVTDKTQGMNTAVIAKTLQIAS